MNFNGGSHAPICRNFICERLIGGVRTAANKTNNLLNAYINSPANLSKGIRISWESIVAPFNFSLIAF